MCAVRIPVVVITQSHSISGVVLVRDQRLSDLLNDRRDSIVHVLDAEVTRLGQARKIEHARQAIVAKDNLGLVFEQQNQATTSAKRPFAYTVKQQYEVFLLCEGLEVRGTMFSRGNLDVLELHRFVATSGERFMPVTNAVVTLPGGQAFQKQAGVLVNVARIHFISKQEPATDNAAAQASAPPAEKPAA